jgi:hypothetical protein
MLHKSEGTRNDKGHSVWDRIIIPKLIYYKNKIDDKCSNKTVLLIYFVHVELYYIIIV